MSQVQFEQQGEEDTSRRGEHKGHLTHNTLRVQTRRWKGLDGSEVV